MNNQNKVCKAYYNLEFLGSKEARVIRLLAEYLEPLRRLKKYNVINTIVFFGSARILPPSEARKNLKIIKDKLKNLKPSDIKRKDKLVEQLEIAKQNLINSKYYSDTEKLAYLLTKWSKSLKNKNSFVVCSGGGPGIMEAANKGARKAKGLSIGFNISLPFEQQSNKFITPELNFEFHYFFMRKFWFAYMAKALVIMPGGFGTLDELMEILTLVQTNKLRKKITIVMYDRKFWDQIIDFKALYKNQMISEGDLNLIKFFDTPEDAFNYLKKCLTKNYIN